MADILPYTSSPMINKDDVWVPSNINHQPKTKYGIFWNNGKLWIEAFKYLSDKRVKSASLRSIAYDLKAYADFLEEYQITWLHFPIKREERCLDIFRGYLINTSTGISAVPTRRMNAVVNFYKWAKIYGHIDKQIQMWDDQKVKLSYFNETGFRRTSEVWTTDLRIPFRKANISKVEGGLLPISPQDRDILLNFLQENSTEQNTILHAMFVLGFFTGARIGSILSLRIENLINATPDTVDANIMLVAAGPGTGIATKFDVNGYLRFLKPVHQFILNYAQTNITRLERQAKAIEKNKSFVFLNKHGKPYSEGSFNTAIFDLRKALISEGLTQFYNLKFHQSRATCGTELARAFMKEGDLNSVREVRDWLMHKNERTTWTYIKFLKKTKQARKAHTEFTKQFLGPNF